jgi:cytochrome c oxidase subunit 2
MEMGSTRVDSSLAAAAVVVVAVVVAVLGAGCGDSAGDEPGTPLEREGRALSAGAGCGSCHGDRGEGRVGPPWVGLAGSEVELADGTTVTADTDYLRRAIAEPDAEIVAGYNLPMPVNSLTEAEIDAVVGYIEGL